MCKVEQDHLISCQISYFPIDSSDYLEAINQVLALIKKSNLKHDIDILSTMIKGEASKVFKLLSQIDKEMTKHHYHYTMSILISNICGCE